MILAETWQKMKLENAQITKSLSAKARDIIPGGAGNRIQNCLLLFGIKIYYLSLLKAIAFLELNPRNDFASSG